jgi:hypothetical protein
MSEINIVFSKEELGLLLKLLYSGSFIVEADDDEKERNINSLIQKVLLSAKINKAYRGIEYNQETNEYELSEKADEALNEEFDEFVEETFWEELLFRLGQRDIIKEIGEIEYRKMSEEELEQKHEDAKEKYRKEFDKNGIKNLEIV